MGPLVSYVIFLKVSHILEKKLANLTKIHPNSKKFASPDPKNALKFYKSSPYLFNYLANTCIHKILLEPRKSTDEKIHAKLTNMKRLRVFTRGRFVQRLYRVALHNILHNSESCQTR